MSKTNFFREPERVLGISCDFISSVLWYDLSQYWCKSAYLVCDHDFLNRTSTYQAFRPVIFFEQRPSSHQMLNPSEGNQICQIIYQFAMSSSYLSFDGSQVGILFSGDYQTLLIFSCNIGKLIIMKKRLILYMWWLMVKVSHHKICSQEIHVCLDKNCEKFICHSKN